MPSRDKTLQRARTKFEIRAAKEAGQRMVALRSHASGRRLFSDKKITHDLGIAKHCVQYLRHARPGVR